MTMVHGSRLASWLVAYVLLCLPLGIFLFLDYDLSSLQSDEKLGRILLSSFQTVCSPFIYWIPRSMSYHLPLPFEFQPAFIFSSTARSCEIDIHVLLRLKPSIPRRLFMLSPTFEKFKWLEILSFRLIPWGPPPFVIQIKYNAVNTELYSFCWYAFWFSSLMNGIDILRRNWHRGVLSYCSNSFMDWMPENASWDWE